MPFHYKPRKGEKERVKVKAFEWPMNIGDYTEQISFRVSLLWQDMSMMMMMEKVNAFRPLMTCQRRVAL